MAITINGTANTVAGLAVGGLPDGTVDADTLASNSVTNVKGADDAIGVAELSTTGTAGSGNFLRGDNSWQTAGSKWTQGASTSVGTGTSVLITGIPATAVMIVLTYHHVSCSSSNEDNFIMRAGTSSGIVTSSGACRGLSAYMQDNDNGEVNTGDDNIPLGPYAFTAHDGYYHGHVILTKWDTGKFHAQGACFQSLSSITGAPTVYAINLTGEIHLSGALERLQLQFHNGTATFDDGDYAIGYLEA